jgi:hypothetical protein
VINPPSAAVTMLKLVSIRVGIVADVLVMLDYFSHLEMNRQTTD